MKLMYTEEVAGIAPIVPAAVWVVSDGDRLRVDDDDVIHFPDLVVASVPSKLVSKTISNA